MLVSYCNKTKNRGEAGAGAKGNKFYSGAT